MVPKICLKFFAEIQVSRLFCKIENCCIYILNLSTWETVKSAGGRQVPVYALSLGDLLRFRDKFWDIFMASRARLTICRGISIIIGIDF